MKNKVSFVAQSYCQKEIIDFDETFTLIGRLESIWMMVAFGYYHDFVIFQMDVKSTFLNVYLNPPGFEDPKYLNYISKLRKDPNNMA